VAEALRLAVALRWKIPTATTASHRNTRWDRIRWLAADLSTRAQTSRSHRCGWRGSQGNLIGIGHSLIAQGPEQGSNARARLALSEPVARACRVLRNQFGPRRPM
jgi:hypothetical protein